MKPLTGGEAHAIAEDIRTELGSWGVSELGGGLPDEIWDRCPAYQRMDDDARWASIQAVAEALYGEGCVYQERDTR